MNHNGEKRNGWARTGSIIAVCTGLLIIATAVFHTGQNVENLNNSVHQVATASCELSAATIDNIRVAISQQVKSETEQARLLALFRPLDCSKVGK